MNTAIKEKPPVVVESEPSSRPETTPVGNRVYVIEASNLVIGSVSDLMEDFEDSQTACARMSEPTETMEKVFSDLHIE